MNSAGPRFARPLRDGLPFLLLTIPQAVAAIQAIQLAIFRLRTNSLTGCVRCLRIPALAHPLRSLRWIVVSSSRTDFEMIVTTFHVINLVDWGKLSEFGAKRSDAHRGVAAALTAHERRDMPARFRNIPVSTAFTPVFRARRFAHGHRSFELIPNLSMPGSSRPVSRVCLNPQGFAPRGLWRSEQKPRSRARPREREKDMRRVWSCLRL
jgi:hypothetical protein